MQQELALADRLVIHDVAVRVLPNVRVTQPSFVSADLTVRVLELDLAVLGRLDLGAAED
jgi:hypothetical protein